MAHRIDMKSSSIVLERSDRPNSLYISSWRRLVTSRLGSMRFRFRRKDETISSFDAIPRPNGQG